MSDVRYAIVRTMFFAVFVAVLCIGFVKRHARRAARYIALAVGRRCAFCQGPRLRSHGVAGGSRFCSTCASDLGVR